MVTLEGVNAKVQRAQDQIEQLSRDIASSCETLWSSFSEELRPDVGDKIWIFRGETPSRSNRILRSIRRNSIQLKIFP